MKKWIARGLAAVVGLALIARLAWAAVQFIYFGGPLGDQGTFAVLGGTTCTFPSDADYTCTQSEYAGGSIRVTGTISARRKVILPLQIGEAKDVFNATIGGFAITVGGATGAATSDIANGTQARVVTPDGVNYYAIAGGAGFDASVGGDLAGTTPLASVVMAHGLGTTDDFGGAGATMRFSGVRELLACANDAGACDGGLAYAIEHVTTTDSTTYKTVASWVPPTRWCSYLEVDCVFADFNSFDAGVDRSMFSIVIQPCVSNGGSVDIVTQNGLAGLAGNGVVTVFPLNPGGRIDGGLQSGITGFGAQAGIDGGLIFTQVVGPNGATYAGACAHERVETPRGL